MSSRTEIWKYKLVREGTNQGIAGSYPKLTALDNYSIAFGDELLLKATE